MTHYVYEIPTGYAANRQIGAYGTYTEASEFARAERHRLEFGDETLILVVFADSSERANASAAHLRLRFDEARRARQAPSGRVALFKREYPAEAEPPATGPALLQDLR